MSRTRLPQPDPCILMTISPTSKVKDVEAFLDSYAVVLSRDSKILQSEPAWQIEHRIRWPDGKHVDGDPEAADHNTLDRPTLGLSLFIRPSPAQEGRTYSRWPFFVEDRKSVV